MSLGTAIRYLKHGDWQRAHEIVRSDESTFGCWAHGIVHMMDGDEGNARYWFRRAHRTFPAGVDAASEIAALAQAWKQNRAPTTESS